MCARRSTCDLFLWLRPHGLADAVSCRPVMHAAYSMMCLRCAVDKMTRLHSDRIQMNIWKQTDTHGASLSISLCLFGGLHHVMKSFSACLYVCMCVCVVVSLPVALSVCMAGCLSACMSVCHVAIGHLLFFCLARTSEHITQMCRQILHSDTFQARARGQIMQYSGHKCCNQSI